MAEEQKPCTSASKSSPPTTSAYSLHPLNSTPTESYLRYTPTMESFGIPLVPNTPTLWPQMDPFQFASHLALLYGHQPAYMPMLYRQNYAPNLLHPISSPVVPNSTALKTTETNSVLATPSLLPLVPLGAVLSQNGVPMSSPNTPSYGMSVEHRKNVVDVNTGKKSQIQSGSVIPNHFKGPYSPAPTQSALKGALEKTARPAPEARPLIELQPAAPPSRICLDFKSSTWQNRPSRIYFDSEQGGLDWALLLGLDAIPRHLVLSERQSSGPIHRLAKSSDYPELHIYNYKPNEPFFELQVWHRTGLVRTTPAGLQPEPTLVLDAYQPSPSRPTLDFKLLRVSLSKGGPFFTIQGNKGLKVHDLYLICILQIGSQLLISRPTSFPSSESRRAAVSSSDESHSSPRSPIDGPRTQAAERPKSGDLHNTSPDADSSWEVWSNDMLSLRTTSGYLPDLYSAIQKKASRTNTPLSSALNIVGRWLCLQKEDFGLEMTVDALVIPMVNESWLLPYMEVEDAKQFLRVALATRFKPSESSNESNLNRSVFIVYITERNMPQLGIAALRISQNCLDPENWFFSPLMIDIVASGATNPTDRPIPSFYVEKEPHGANTRSNELNLCVSKFARVTGWLPL